MSKKKTELDFRIKRKTEYAEDFFKTIPNGKKMVIDEVLKQIVVCEELGIRLMETQIEDLCCCTSAISVQNKVRTLKMTA